MIQVYKEDNVLTFYEHFVKSGTISNHILGGKKSEIIGRVSQD
jgi:hypothetical protein